MVEVKEFLNPTSMLTPGIAGGLAVSVSLPLAVNFDLSFKWIVLLVSFLLSFIIIASFKEITSKPTKALYLVLNTLIIFSVSIGAGVSVDPPPSPPKLSINAQPADVHTGDRFTKYMLLISPVYADETNNTQNNVNQKDKQENGELSESHEVEKLKVELLRVKEKAEREKQLRFEQEQKIKEYKVLREKYDSRWSW